MIEMFEKSYPHVETLVKKSAKTGGERVQLSVYGKRGVESQKRTRAKQKPLPLFVGDLDPQSEFPLHHVLYRGAHFVYLEKRSRVSKARLQRAALLGWVKDPENYRDECRQRDTRVNLHSNPID